jgi:hypothetical protein
MFVNLNISTNNMIDSKSLPKLDDLYQLFAEINSNYSSFSKFFFYLIN